MAIEVRTIDYVEGVVVTSDQRRLPIANLFTRTGLSTHNPRDAVLCVVGEPGQWLSFKLAEFDRRSLQ